MASYLEATGSSYIESFERTFKGVVAGILEARDITLYLKPMQPHFDNIEGNDFMDSRYGSNDIGHERAPLGQT